MGLPLNAFYLKLRLAVTPWLPIIKIKWPRRPE